jgi:dihydroorotase
VHLRDGAAMASVVGFTAERFGRAIVMPNLKPPITTTELAGAYRRGFSPRCRPAAVSNR